MFRDRYQKEMDRLCPQPERLQELSISPLDSVTFIDESECSAWAAESVRQVSGGLKTGLHGEDENRFYPKAHYTREHALMIMTRLFKTISDI